MDVLSHATNRIAEGEVLQLLNCNDPDTSEAQYLEVITRKTATLFEAGSRLAAIIAERPKSEEQALADYGLHLGMAFQMIDDALDYGSSDEDIGKNLGDDLAEGKPTLPLIRAIQTGTKEQQQLLKAAIEKGGADMVDEVMAAIESTDAIAYTARRAKEEAELAKKALEALPASAYNSALTALADFSVQCQSDTIGV
jgi:octaprenyl-diphosphate synthase